MRLIHTGDWQIGKVFRFVDEETMPLLQAARIDAVRRLGQLAVEQGVKAVLVAGDVYDKEGLSERTLAQPLERMREFSKIAWHLIPGNHDPHRPNGIWHRVKTIGLPANVHIHIEAGPIALDERSYLLPSPLHHHQSNNDPTSWMDEAATPEGAKRIGLAHGSITDFGETAPTANLIPPDRARRSGLTYLALGDWHGTRKIGEDTWYAGTPEPDRFHRPASGQALLVDLASHAKPRVTPLETGKFRWLSEQVTLHEAGDIDALIARLRGEHEDLSSLLLDLRVDGRLSLEGRARFEQEIEVSLSAALCHLRLSLEGLSIDPSPEDLDELARDHVISAAVAKLKRLVEAGDEVEREVAARALQHLYLACHKRHREAAA